MAQYLSSLPSFLNYGYADSRNSIKVSNVAQINPYLGYIRVEKNDNGEICIDSNKLIDLAMDTFYFNHIVGHCHGVQNQRVVNSKISKPNQTIDPLTWGIDWSGCKSLTIKEV